MPKAYPVLLTSTGDSAHIAITEPDLRAQGLALETWATSSVLASVLHTLGDLHLPRRLAADAPVPVLELGAGTGLVGLAAGLVWDVPVVLTDLAPIVPGLAANIALNAGAFAERGRPAPRCGSLDWAAPGTLTLAPQGEGEEELAIPSASKAHVIIAADTIYAAEHPPLLAGVICEWLRRDEDARVIVGYPLRACYLDEIRELWRLLEEGGLEAVLEGQARADEERFDDECLIEWCVWRWKDIEVRGE